MTRSEDIAKARKIDTQIAEAWDLYWEAMKEVERLESSIESTENMLRHYYGPNSSQHERYTKKLADLQTKLAEAVLAAAPLRAAAVQMDEDLYEGWNRFFLVQHIHSSQHCSSFRLRTRIGWLPDVSGLTEAEAVKEHGATLCTICFPSAPVELTTKPVDPNQCTGSGKYHDTEHLTGREHAYSGKSGYCPDCGRWQTVTASGNMRKHKANDETRRHW